MKRKDIIEIINIIISFNMMDIFEGEGVLNEYLSFRFGRSNIYRFNGE